MDEKAATIEKIYKTEYAEVLRSRDYALRCFADGGTIPYYYATFYYVPKNVLSDDEEWEAFVEGQRRGISEILGRDVQIETTGWGNGHGVWTLRVDGGGK